MKTAIEAAHPNLPTLPDDSDSAACAHVYNVYMYKRTHGEYTLKVGEVGVVVSNPFLKPVSIPQPPNQRLGQLFRESLRKPMW